MIDERRIAVSTRIFCRKCQDWIALGGSIRHDSRDATSHLSKESQEASLADDDDVILPFVSFLFKRGDPFSGIDELRQNPAFRKLPSSRHMGGIMFLLKTAIRDAIRRECAAAQYVSLALNRWSDPRRRRYEGVTVRLIRADLTPSVHLLAFKKLVKIHDTSHELDRLIGWVLDRYHIKDKLLIAAQVVRPTISLSSPIKVSRVPILADCGSPAAVIC
jgi:hypothetical protein